MADDEFRLVSERDEKEIAAERAYSDLVWRTKQLAAQPEQESVSLNKFITAVESYTDAWEKHRTKLAKGIVTQRPR